MTNREIDREIAEEVMGECWHDWDLVIFDSWENSASKNRCKKCGVDTGGSISYPEHLRNKKYSTNIQDAFKVVEKMKLYFRLESGFNREIWKCRFDGYDDGEVVADTPSMAICLAARKAIKQCSI